MISFEGLTKKFGERAILKGVSASFEKGNIACLVGPSGGGKSTLLRCLNGLETFDAGTVTVAGETLHAGTGREHHRAVQRIRLRVGFVFQQWHLFAHRTALGNVIEAPVHVKKKTPVQATEHARTLLETVGMSHRETAYPAEMSGGEQQRVAIARALAMEPDVLLLDEPTSALDPERVSDVVELLSKLASTGLTLLAVTHDIRFVRSIASHVVVLHSGEIVEQGSARQVLDAPSDHRTRTFLAHDGP